MIDILELGFMQRALAAGVLVGLLCSVVGVYVVLRGLSFIGAGISHASFAGVAIGLALGISPVLSAVIFCVLVAWGIGYVARRSQIREDTSVGIFFAATMALGVLIIALLREYQVDIFGYLFGSIVSVTPTDIVVTLVISAIVLGCIWIFYKDLLFVVFDSETAEVTGLPAERLYFMLLTLVALTIVVSIKVVGIILVQALIVIPAAAAYQLTEKFWKMMVISAIFGVSSCLAGLLISDLLEVPPGAAIVLLATVIFGVSAAVSPRRRAARTAPNRPEQG